MAALRCQVRARSVEAEPREYCGGDDDETDDVNDIVHGKSFLVVQACLLAG